MDTMNQHALLIELMKRAFKILLKILYKKRYYLIGQL